MYEALFWFQINTCRLYLELSVPKEGLKGYSGYVLRLFKVPDSFLVPADTSGGTSSEWDLVNNLFRFLKMKHNPAEKLMDKPWYSHGKTMICDHVLTDFRPVMIIDETWFNQVCQLEPCHFRPRPWSSSTLKWLQYDTVKINWFGYEMAMVNTVHIIPIKSWSDHGQIRLS